MPEDTPIAVDDSAVRDASDRLAARLVESGWSRMPAVVFTCLLCSDSDGLTSAQLTDYLSISAASVSQAVRFLSGIGLVDRVRRPGSRRELYRVRNGVWHEVIARGVLALARIRDSLRETHAVLGSGSPSARRMADAVAFYEFYEAQTAEMLQRWDELQRARD